MRLTGIRVRGSTFCTMERAAETRLSCTWYGVAQQQKKREPSPSFLSSMNLRNHHHPNCNLNLVLLYGLLLSSLQVRVVWYSTKVVQQFVIIRFLSFPGFFALRRLFYEASLFQNQQLATALLLLPAPLTKTIRK